MDTRTAFASDYDGTLRVGLGPLSYRRGDLAAISAYQEAGGLFGLCTGRAMVAIRDTIPDSLHLDFCITLSGAQVYDGERGLIENHGLPHETASRICEACRPSAKRIMFSTDEAYYGFGTIPLIMRSLIRPVRSAEEVPCDIHGISMGFRSPEAASHAVTMINEQFADVVAAFQNRESVDVVPLGCSKGTGLACVRDKFGVGTTAGIGDSFNDVPLLDEADVAYTFRRSPEDVRSHADVLVGTVAEAIADFSR